MGEEEIKFSIEIWSDDIINSHLEITHKNADTLFSERIYEDRRVTPPEAAVYIKVRNAIRKSGVSTNLKNKFPINWIAAHHLRRWSRLQLQLLVHQTDVFIATENTSESLLTNLM